MRGHPYLSNSSLFWYTISFNPYIIDKVAVYTGGFGAEYGGRVSSVIQLESETVDIQTTKIGVGTNLVYSFLDGQLTSKDGKFSTVFSPAFR